MSSYLNVVAAYDGQADMLAERYEAVSSERMLAEVLPLIPGGSDSKLALDVGAGTGRDAAWLTSLAYEVVAVEPAAECCQSNTNRSLHDAFRSLTATFS